MEAKYNKIRQTNNNSWATIWEEAFKFINYEQKVNLRKGSSTPVNV